MFPVILKKIKINLIDTVQNRESPIKLSLVME